MLRREEIAPTWRISRELRAWQSEALAAWIANGARGVVEAATGTGKTMVALAAIQHLHEVHGGSLRVAVVVPTKALAYQWRRELQENLRIESKLIGEQHSSAQIEWHFRHPVLVTVLNSARGRLAPVLEHWSRVRATSFLVVDECHRSGSPANARIFEGYCDHTLGLSATPERDDGGEDEYVYPNLGEPVFRYPLRKALDDEGVLAPLQSVNLYVDFDADERHEWDRLGGDLAGALAALTGRHPELRGLPSGLFFSRVGELARRGEATAERTVSILSRRRMLLSKAESRGSCHAALLAWLAQTGRRAIVFHETIDAAERSVAMLEDLGLRPGMDHSRLSAGQRHTAMARFKRGTVSVLVAVRALDEGIDVPDADVAIITAGSRSTRQRIQRLGRILRMRDGKQALAVTILVRGTPEEPFVGARDAELLGAPRIRHHRWPAVELELALAGQQSTYTPVPPTLDTTIAEQATWQALASPSV